MTSITNHKKKLIVIVGPTAVGKTSLSIELAKHFKAEIISADSRQFFKEISIGTAKPTIQEMDGVIHHFIDSHSIKDDYNVSEFERDALEVINQLFLKILRLKYRKDIDNKKLCRITHHGL